MSVGKEKINVLSLFDGISCGQIALERVGIEVENYFASEIEPSPIKVTQTNYPNTKQLGSVLNVKGVELPKIDLLIGGSPCQGFSFAGKQLNFDDPRSKLFFEYVRLKNELNPKYFLLENVKMKKEYQDIISNYLGVEPIMINSNLVSAQNRVRYYWTNIPVKELPNDRCILLKDITEDGLQSLGLAQRGRYDENGDFVLTDSWGERKRFLELHIPCKSGGHSIKQLPMQLGIDAILSHIEERKKQLEKLKLTCKTQLL